MARKEQHEVRAVSTFSDVECSAGGIRGHRENNGIYDRSPDITYRNWQERSTRHNTFNAAFVPPPENQGKKFESCFPTAADYMTGGLIRCPRIPMIITKILCHAKLRYGEVFTITSSTAMNTSIDIK